MYLTANPDSVEEAFVKILGLRPKCETPWLDTNLNELTIAPLADFRPPYGATNAQLENILRQRGYTKSFIWSDDSRDSAGASVQEQQNFYNNIANTYPAPHLILNHSPLASSE